MGLHTLEPCPGQLRVGAEHLANAYGPSLRIRTVPYAAPDAFSEPAQAGAEPAPIADLGAPATPLVVSVSRHVPRKGVDLLLLALARVAASGAGFRACLVGPGKLLTSHRRLASALGLDRQLVIPGLVPDVAPYLSAADIFVLPSVAESSGSVSVLEAMRAGKPVIATACDGLPEDLIDGENGLLVAPGDVGALAEALRRLLADAELRSRLGAAARLTYERRFSADRFVEALADVYGASGFTPGATRDSDVIGVPTPPG